MATIITFAPPQAPVRTPVRRRGYHLAHQCEDASGKVHRQKLPLGSIRGVTHLDAMCIHCGAHFMWVEDHHLPPEAGEELAISPQPEPDPAASTGETKPTARGDAKI